MGGHRGAPPRTAAVGARRKRLADEPRRAALICSHDRRSGLIPVHLFSSRFPPAP